MSARHDLAAELSAAAGDGVDVTADPLHYADWIIAAGWRPPARTVTTEAEMFPMLMAVSTEAEPAHVRDAQRRHWLVTEDDRGQFWCWSWRQEDDDAHRPVRIHELPGPLTVLHEPEGGA